MNERKLSRMKFKEIIKKEEELRSRNANTFNSNPLISLKFLRNNHVPVINEMMMNEIIDFTQNLIAKPIDSLGAKVCQI